MLRNAFRGKPIGSLRPRSSGIGAEENWVRFARFGGGLSRRAFAPGAFRLELRFIGRVRRFAPSAFARAAAVLFEAAAVS